MSVVVGSGITLGGGIIISSEAAPGPVTENLVLNLDAANYSGSGNWLDTSGQGNDATLTGTPTYVSGSGSYFDMSGGASTGPTGNDSFGVADHSSLDDMTAITFEIWFNIDSFQSPGSPNLLFGKRTTSSNGYLGFFTNTGYTFRVGTSSSSQLAYSTTPSLSTWQQLVVTVSSAGSKIYINGSSVVTNAYTGNFANIDTATTLRIGDISIAASGIYAFRGFLGIFRIYNTALDQDQVLDNYNAVASRYGL